MYVCVWGGGGCGGVYILSCITKYYTFNPNCAFQSEDVHVRLIQSYIPIEIPIESVLIFSESNRLSLMKFLGLVQVLKVNNRIGFA